jgi:hypothetical protein
MPFEDNNEIITGFFETNETPHRHTATDLLINMDPVYVYNIAKAATGAMLHFAKASTSSLDIIDYSEKNQVCFFPSPAKDILNISRGSLTDSNYTFSIIDLQGKVVLEQQIDNANLIESISIQSLPKGMYLAVLQTSTKRINKKIIIE